MDEKSRLPAEIESKLAEIERTLTGAQPDRIIEVLRDLVQAIREAAETANDDLSRIAEIQRRFIDDGLREE